MYKEYGAYLIFHNSTRTCQNNSFSLGQGWQLPRGIISQLAAQQVLPAVNCRQFEGELRSRLRAEGQYHERSFCKGETSGNTDWLELQAVESFLLGKVTDTLLERIRKSPQIWHAPHRVAAQFVFIRGKWELAVEGNLVQAAAFLTFIVLFHCCIAAFQPISLRK